MGLSPDAAKAVNVVGEDFWTLVGTGGIAITALATGVSLLAHRAASKWWAIGAIATGVIAIIGWFTPFGLFLEGIWILAFSIRLLLRRAGHPVLCRGDTLRALRHRVLGGHDPGHAVHARLIRGVSGLLSLNLLLLRVLKSLRRRQ